MDVTNSNYDICEEAQEYKKEMKATRKYIYIKSHQDKEKYISKLSKW